MNIVDEFADFVFSRQNSISKLYAQQFVKVELEKISFEDYMEKDKNGKWILDYRLEDIAVSADENFKNYIILYFGVSDEDLKNVIFQYIARSMLLEFKIFDYRRQSFFVKLIKAIICIVKKFFPGYGITPERLKPGPEQLMNDIYSSMRKCEFYNCPRYIESNYVAAPEPGTLFESTCEDIFHKLFKNKFVVLDTDDRFLGEYIINKYISIYSCHFQKICSCDFYLDFDLTMLLGLPWSNVFINTDYAHHSKSCQNYLAQAEQKHLFIFIGGADFLKDKKFDEFIKNKNIYCIFVFSSKGKGRRSRKITEENTVSCYSPSADELYGQFKYVSKYKEESVSFSTKLRKLMIKEFSNIYAVEIFARSFSGSSEHKDKVKAFLENKSDQINNDTLSEVHAGSERELFKSLSFIFSFIELGQREIELLFLLCLCVRGQADVASLETLTGMEWNDQILTLQAKGLVFYHKNLLKKIVKINPVLLNFIPEYFKMNHRSEIFNVFAENLSRCFKTDNQREISSCIKEACIAFHIVGKYRRYQSENSAVRSLVIKIADFMYYAGHYSESAKYYRLSLEAYREEKNPDVYFNLSLCLGNCLYSMQKYDELENLYSRLIQSYKKREGRFCVKMAVLYYNTAKVYYKNNKKNRAIDLCKKAMDIFKNSFDENLLHLRNFYMVSSVLHIKSKEYDEALFCLKQAAAETERLFGQDSDETIDCYQKIASLYSKLHMPGKSIEWFTMALNIYKDSPEKYSIISIADIYSKLASEYRCTGRYEKSLSCLDKSLAVYYAVFGSGSIYTADIFKSTAEVLCTSGKFESSLEFCLKDLQICEAVLPKNDPRFCHTYKNLSAVCLKLCRLDESAKWIDRSVYILAALAENVNRFELAENYVLAGKVYIQKSMYNKALNFYFEKALKIYKDYTPQPSEELLGMYSFLGDMYGLKSNYPKQEHYFRKAVGLCKKYLPENSHSLAEAYLNMGDSCSNMCNFKKAIECFEKALKIYRDNHAPAFFHINALIRLSSAYTQIGLYSKAVNLSRKTEYIVRKNNADDSIQNAMVCFNTGCILRALGKYDEALEYFEKSLALYEKMLGKQHVCCANILRNMAVVYDVQGLHIEGKDLCRKAITILERIFGKNHLYTSEAYNDMASIYVNQGMCQNARKWSLAALDIQKKFLPKNHVSLARAYTNAGLAYDLEDRYSDALGNYFRALEIYENIFQADHVMLGVVYNYVALSYKSGGKYDKSMKYFRLAKKILSKSLGKEHYYLNINEKGTQLVSKKLLEGKS